MKSTTKLLSHLIKVDSYVVSLVSIHVAKLLETERYSVGIEIDIVIGVVRKTNAPFEEVEILVRRCMGVWVNGRNIHYME